MKTRTLQISHRTISYFTGLSMLAALGILLFTGSARAQEQEQQEIKLKAPDSVEELQRRINEIVNHPRYMSALWGVKVASLDSGKVLYEINAEKLFTPASNSKLYSMALALDHLGPDYRIKTSLFAHSHPGADGTLKGDLVLYGRGDPTITGEPMKAFAPLVAALKNAGVKQITGDVVGDDSFFHSAEFGSGWDWGDFGEYYGAEISALTYNSNLVQLVVKPGTTVGAPAELSWAPSFPYVTFSNRTRTVAQSGRYDISIRHPVMENVIYVYGTVPLESKGSAEDVTMHDPAAWIAGIFKDVLEKNGITVAGRSRSMHWIDHETAPLNLKEMVELGSVQSLPLRDIIRLVQKPSNNLYTDLIFEHVGALASPGMNAENSGVRELYKFMQKAGLTRGQTIFEEGSGLSRQNVTSPDNTVALLTYMSHQKDADVYINALPIAGVDGTLRRRMKGTPAANNLRGKTGTLRWAHSLSGYVTSAAGEHLVFSIMLNRFQNYERDRSTTRDLDAIGELLASFPVRTGQVAAADKPAADSGK